MLRLRSTVAGPVLACSIAAAAAAAGAAFALANPAPQAPGSTPSTPTPPAASPDSPAQPPSNTKPKEPAVDSMVLGHVLTSIDGRPTDLAQYKGSVVLIVNVASQCGLTPQYEGLQALYAKHRQAGLVVLGFPCNDFMGQEPGTEADIAKFCSTRYSVTFPMFAKVAVKGPATAPLYKQLIAQPAPIGGELEWNFTKFLVGRDGRVVARFGPRVTPADPKLNAELVRALAVPVPDRGSPPASEPKVPAPKG